MMEQLAALIRGFLSEFGLATTLLIGLLIGLGLCVRWIGNNVVKPWVRSHMAFIEGVRRSVRSQARSARRIEESVRQQGINLDKATQMQRQTLERLDKLIAPQSGG